MNKTKTAMITVCGRPNVGKSSLTNALVGEKIAIVSNKPQTTRNRIYGVVNRGDTQYVLLDTPGFHKARNRLGDYMVKVTRESIADVDAVLLLVEPVAHVGIPEAELIEKIKASHLPAILCINKIDTVEKKDDLLAVIAAYSEAYAFDAIIPISARTHEGLDDLMNELGKYASEGPQLFPDGMTTDQPDRQVVGEIVREKLLRNLDKEIPHGTAVEITRFIERDDEVIEVDATIYCEKASHKGIIIGKNGAMLKKISTEARQRHRALHGHKGLPRDLGQGQRKLARQYELYQKLRLRRAVKGKIMSDKKEKKTDDSGNCMIFGMLIGMSIGFALGQPLFNNMAAGMASGTCIGMAIGSFIDCIKKQ